MYRQFVITGTESVEEPSEWNWVVRDRKLLNATFCEFGLAEEVVGLLVFEDKDGEDVAEVGIGESMRPYDKVFEGDFEEASHIFVKTILKLAISEELGGLFDNFKTEQKLIVKALIDAKGD
jgi:hypothetical protein